MKQANMALLALVLAGYCAAFGQGVEFHSPVISRNMSASSSFGVIWDTPRSAWMPKCAQPPKMDGQLDDACWREAALLTGFVSGSTNATPPYRNRVRLCYDETAFYVGCEFGEPKPKALQATVKDHNSVQIWLDDCVELHIEVDSRTLYIPDYQGKPTWFQFITNTAAARFAELVCERRPGSKRFHPLPVHDQWQSAASVGNDAFIIEIAVPWKLLQIAPADGGSFRMNVGRNKPYSPESWNTNAYHSPDRFGTVHFGRQDKDGLEIRESLVNCAGDDWTVSVDVVAASKPRNVVLSAELKRDGKALAAQQGAAVTVGVQPATLALPLRVTEPGVYDVEVKLASEAGDVLAKGHVRATRKPLLERFFLFRRDFYPGEKVIKGYLRLATLPQNRRLTAQFELKDGERSLARSEPCHLASAEAQFDFAVPALAEGRPALRLSVLDDQGPQVATLTRELHVRPFVPVEREQVRFRVDEPAGVAREAWPITAGIPLGEGMLAAEDVEKRTRILDASGKELPCQTRVFATWTDAGRHAKWVLFDFQGDLAAGKGADFVVEFGTAVSRAAPPTKPLVEESPDGDLTVNTGPLRTSLSTDEPVFFADVSFDGRKVTQRPKDGELYLKFADPALIGGLQPHQHEYRTDRSTKAFLAELCKQDYKLEVEYAGPIRSVIKAMGWYGGKDGARLFRYILRLYVCRNSTSIAGFHTLIATEPEQYVYSMGLRLQGPGQPQAVSFGGDSHQPIALPLTPVTGELALIQPYSDCFKVLEYPQGEAPNWGTQRGSGRRASGWCSAGYGNTNLMVAVKDFWQEYPKELAVRVSGELDIGFVGMRSPGHMDLRSSPFAAEEQATGSSEGVAKTTRFVLDFQKQGPDSAETVNRAKAALSDLAVWVDPDWLQRADPLWSPVARCTPDAADPLKRAYANHVAMHGLNQPNAPEIVHGLPLYGILNYGDRAHGMATRGWFNNEDYALPFAEWIAYLATGGRPVFDAVTAFTRHLMDVDALNCTTASPGCLGLQSRHKRIHWGQPAIVTHSYLDQSLLYYYLLGYERGADHAALIREGQSVWEWWPSEGWYSPENPSGAVARDYGVTLRILMDAYLHCWDPVLLVRAHELWMRYSEGFMAYGDHLAGYFNVPRGLELYTRTTGDPTAIDAVLKSEELCPVLCADLGRPEKLQSWLGEAERLLANAHERLEVPWWELRFGQENHSLETVLVIGACEKLKRQGKEVPPIRGGHIKFRDDMDILLQEEKDQKHPVRLRILGAFDNAKAAVFDPSGKPVLEKQFNTKDLPLAHQGRELALEVPEDKVTGTYLLRFRGLTGGYTRCWLTEAPAKRVHLVKPGEFSLGSFYGTRFWFFVPGDCAGFRLGAKPSNRSTRWGFAVYDSQGRLAGSKAWYYSSQLDSPETQWLDIQVPEDARGAWWNIPYTCAKDMTFVWPKELPTYLADSPTSGFIPDPESLRRAAPAKE